MSSTTTTTRTREEQEHACPYAAALPPTNNTLQLQCPAFAGGTCPFKDATTATAMKQKLQQMPESHMKHSSSFVHFLQEMHQVVPAVPLNAFHIPGGCPVMSNDKSVSFREALEEMSLAAIMARLMKDTQDDDEEESREQQQQQQHIFQETLHLNQTLHSQQQQQQQHTLSESLKTGTARSHQAAENVHFVQNFIQGKIDRDLYATMVGMLYHVYVKLEVLLDQHAPASFPSCHFPVELRRTETLAQDVDFWHGTVVPGVSPATQDYMDRLQFIATTDPLLLLAHAYTRYLGDLSGGKVLARVARRALSLHGDGLDFYAFEHISSVKLFKDQYRSALDALSLTEDQVQRVVAEANVAFCLNMRLFEELDVQANVPGAMVRPLNDALAFATAPTTNAAVSEECPFLKKSSKNTTVAVSTTKRCPWPFVLAHDPVQGMKDWQTWLVLGLILCWIWSMLQQQQRNNNN